MLTKRFRNLSYIGLGIILICAVAYLAHPVLLRSVGGYLIVEDPLEQASAIIVLSAQSPYRVLEGARLYKDGWAPKVVLTRPSRKPSFDTFESLGIHLMEWHELHREVLLRSGVQSEAIVVIDQEVENTLAELKAVLQTLSPPSGATLIIVTSNYHTRRTQEIWGYLTDGNIRGIIHWARDDDPVFDTETWWKNRDFIRLLVNEYGGLVNYWLGFPLGMALL